jgi:hypothetical protein
MVDYALNHRGHLGRGGRLELRVDAERFPLNMPVDHDSTPTVAKVPLVRIPEHADQRSGLMMIAIPG